VEYFGQPSMSSTVAVVGKRPTITGFGALVASNRGLTIFTVLRTSSSARLANGIAFNRRYVVRVRFGGTLILQISRYNTPRSELY